ncbi:ABC transporter permease [Christensenellaceae bacterium OttesenSCG-928-K19]|nr:ABC transporter permease [Christensenellaceae bacterium OttesenSCG-928-K19]
MEKQVQKTGFLRKIEKSTLWLLLLLIGLVVVVSIAAPKQFVTLANFQSMGFQLPEFGIMSLGMMICMIAGGIDLSIVGMANLSGIVAAAFMHAVGVDSTAGMAGGICLALVVGMACGAFNGLLIGGLRIPAMLVTLCAQQIFMGLGLVITKGPAIAGLSEAYQVIGNGVVANAIPIALVLFIGVAVVLFFVMKYTVYGQQLYLLGSNPVASRYSGVNNIKVIVKTHMISGLLAAVAGIVISSHYGSAKSDYGSAYTLQTLLICILGGISPVGGKGKLAGVVLAIVIIQVISSAFGILRVDSFLKTFVFGLILIAVMIMQYWAGSGSKKIKTTKEKQIG